MTGGLLFFLLAWPLLAMGGATYRYERPVDAPAGLSALELPDDVLDACRPGLPDLRLMIDDQEVPYAFERRVAFTSRIPLINVESAPGRGTTAIADRGPSAGLTSWLSVETPSTVFVKPILVEASDDRVVWMRIGQSSIFATDAVRMTTVRFPPTSRRYLRISLDDRNGAPIQPDAIVLPAHESQEPAPREIRLPTTVVTSDEPGRSTFAVTLPARNLPLSALRIGSTDPVFSRPARIYEKVLLRDEISRRLLGEGHLVRSGTSGETQDSVRVSDASAQALEIEVDNGDSPPLTVPEVTAIIEPKRILFYRPAKGILSMRYGSQAASAPHYDLDATFAFTKGVPDKLARAVAGAAKDNGPQKGPLQTPTRGGSVDRSRWQRSAPVILPDTPGVAYLELDASLAADASSLRIVDSKATQVPYIFEESTHRVRTATQFEVSRRDSHTIATVTGLDVRQPIDAIEFAVGGPSYFSRDVSVVEDVHDSRGVTGQRVLGFAHWERRPGEAAVPCRIALAAPGAATLKVDIDDGDNAPLALESAAIEFARRRIDFLFDRGDAFWVLSQNPEAPPPRYDLGLLASTVLASPALQARLGPTVETLPAKRGSSRWFWAAVVIAAVLVLLALARTLRTLPA